MAESKLCFIGWYNEHPIRIVQDDDKRFRILFEALPVSDLEGRIVGEMQFSDDTSYYTLDSAKLTACTLAQKKLRGPFQERIEWRDLRED